MAGRKQKKGGSILLRIGIFILIVILIIILFGYLLQRYRAHREERFVPDYPKVSLSEESDNQTIFLQTGLGKQAVDKLRREGQFQRILQMQNIFWHQPEVECVSLLGWFTMEDRVRFVKSENEEGREETENLDLYPFFVDLQPGDIILTLSTHSVGWRHGHVALVLDENTTLECMTWGQNVTYGNLESWRNYSDIAILRVKGVTPQLQQRVVEYGCENLYDTPYHLTAGLLKEKAPNIDAPEFGTQCAYLVWYVWKQFGYDLDSDGGRLVTAYDLLHSKELEVVQIYGMNPLNFPRFKKNGKNSKETI